MGTDLPIGQCTFEELSALSKSVTYFLTYSLSGNVVHNRFHLVTE